MEEHNHPKCARNKSSRLILGSSGQKGKFLYNIHGSRLILRSNSMGLPALFIALSVQYLKPH